jgi:hypothetical protein
VLGTGMLFESKEDSIASLPPCNVAGCPPEVEDGFDGLHSSKKVREIKIPEQPTLKSPLASEDKHSGTHSNSRG